MATVLTLDEALARGEILAANTTESTHVVRVGEWVYKFLKPFRTADVRRPEAYVRQLNFRCHVSHAWPEFNPVTFAERTWLVVLHVSLTAVGPRLTSAANFTAACVNRGGVSRTWDNTTCVFGKVGWSQLIS